MLNVAQEISNYEGPFPFRHSLFKFEIRSTKSEKNSNDPNSNFRNGISAFLLTSLCSIPFRSLSHLNLEFVSNFEIRISDFYITVNCSRLTAKRKKNAMVYKRQLGICNPPLLCQGNKMRDINLFRAHKGAGL